MYFTWIAATSQANAYGQFNLAPFTTTTDDANYILGSREASQTWISNSGESLYIFGGLGFPNANGGGSKGYLQDLWRFDVLTRQWAWLSKKDPSGSYSSQSGNFGLGNVADPDNIPGGRWKAATWIDDDDGLWMFGGQGFDVQGNLGYLRDMWWFRQSDQNWIPQNYISGGSYLRNLEGDYTTPSTSDTIPGSRYGSFTWKVGNRFYLFAGFGYNDNGNDGYLNDLWYWDLSTKSWHFVAGTSSTNMEGKYSIQGTSYSSSVSYPGGRITGASWIAQNQHMYIFGGLGRASAVAEGRLNDLWRYDHVNDEWTWVGGPSYVNAAPVYGTMGEEDLNNLPGARSDVAFTQSITDGHDIFLLFGGFAVGTSGPGYHDDLWQYNVTTSMWTWIAGTNDRTQTGVYNIRGSASSNTLPGVRRGASAWYYNETTYLFGGFGRDASTFGNLHDMWIYDKSYACNQLLYTDSSVCSAHGECTSPETCECSYGYDGDWCQHTNCYGLLSNDTSVCSSRGICEEPNSCNCTTGYAGPECQFNICYDVLSNETTVCSGNGVCTNPDDCDCTTGYVGSSCEYSTCFGYWSNDTSVCSGHGSCVTPDNCNCSTGYGNSACQHSLCFGYLSNDVNVCSGHGTCLQPDQCSCQWGYNGTMCEHIDCFGILSNDTDNVCSGHGTCPSPDNCVCSTGHDGLTCELYDCFGTLSNESATVCSGHGSCIDVDQCSCQWGYNGTMCEFSDCFGYLSNDAANVCSGHGSCVSPDTCQCSTGHAGMTCELFDCFGTLSNESATVCSGHGSCVDVNQCSCQWGYNGTMCELFDCFGFLSNDVNIVCSSHGNCTAPDICTCDAHWFDEQCSIAECFGYLANDTSNVCSSFGNCVSPDICQCYTGHGGPMCELFNCFGTLSNESATVCSGHGSCIDVDQCSCQWGYNGTMCEFSDCFGYLSNDAANVCSGHGSCVSPDTCQCSTGHAGMTCELFDCFGTLSNESATVCSGHGSCIDVNQCSCQWGYNGTMCEFSDCFGYLSNDVNNVCSSHGNCTAPDMCTCDAHWFDEQCSTPECFGFLSNDSRVCNNGNGTCSSAQVCTCNSNWYGSTCNVTECYGYFSNDTTRVCSAHGDCFLPAECSCGENYFGDSCELHYCYNVRNDNNSVCSSHGSCEAHNSCSCEDGYVGVECEQYACYNISSISSDVCSSHGACVSVDNCSCSSNYYGQMCELHYCYDIRNDNESVCSGNGYCEAYNSCNCTNGYYGADCSEFSCFGIHYSNESACNYAAGNCTAPDICACTNTTLFYGASCSNYSCYGLDSTDSDVCSSHGGCIARDTCNCSSGWVSEQCQHAICFGKNATDPTACFGNGACVDVDTCQCQAPFAPPECQDFGNFCFNVSALLFPDLVCSGHGDCIGHNNCSCVEGYFGPNCSAWNCANVLYNSSLVCSSQGSCVSPDNCSCLAGYYDDVCSSFDCFDILYTSSDVCSSHGSCTSPDTCSCSSGYGSLNCSTWLCDGIDSRNSSVCSYKGVCQAPNSCDCLPGYSDSFCSKWEVDISPSTGYALYSSFRLNIPPDIDTSYVHLNISYEHPYTKVMEQPVWDDTQFGVFSMPIYGAIEQSYQTQMYITLQPINSSANIPHSQSLSFTQTLTVYPLNEHCNKAVTSPVCSPILSNFSSYFMQTDSKTTSDLLRVLEAPANAMYDCEGWGFSSTGECSVDSLVYSKVNCKFPSSSFGFCQDSTDSCSCHPSYTGIDCSIPKSDIFGMQELQVQLISQLNSLVSSISQSSSLIERDLKLTQCLINDLHSVDYDLLEAALSHLSQLFNEASRGGTLSSAEKLTPENAALFFRILSLYLDMLYLKDYTIVVEKTSLIPRVRDLVFAVSEQQFVHVTQGLISSLESEKISAYLLDDLKTSFAGKQLTHDSGALLKLPSESVAPTLSRMRVLFIVFDYDLYAYSVSDSNVTSGTYSVKFYDASGVEHSVKNLAESNSIELHIPGSWDLSTSEDGATLEYDKDVCRFWDTSSTSWNSDGCRLSDLQPSLAICSCTHATDFALDRIFTYEIPPVPGEFNWMLIAIIGGSVLAGVATLCCLCCLALCMCLCCVVMTAVLRKVGLKVPHIGTSWIPTRTKNDKKKQAADDFDIYEKAEHDEHSGSKLLPMDQDWHSLDSIGGPYRPDRDDDTTSIIPELRDQLRQLGSAENPEEVARLKEKISDLKEKHRRRKELDEMKNHMTSLMGLRPLNDSDAQKHLQELQKRQQRMHRDSRSKTLESSPGSTLDGESPLTPSPHPPSPMRRRRDEAPKRPSHDSRSQHSARGPRGHCSSSNGYGVNPRREDRHDYPPEPSFENHDTRNMRGSVNSRYDPGRRTGHGGPSNYSDHYPPSPSRGGASSSYGASSPSHAAKGGNSFDAHRSVSSPQSSRATTPQYKPKMPGRYNPTSDIQNPVIREQLDEFQNQKEKRSLSRQPQEKEFHQWEQQMDEDEREPLAGRQIQRMEKQINRNNEQIADLQKQERSYTSSPSDAAKRQHSSKALVKLRFQNKMLQKRINEYAQRYGQNPDRLRLKRQIDNLRRQYQNNKDLIHNLEMQLDSEARRVATSPTNSKSPAITRFTKQIEEIENANEILIKKGNNLMSQYFDLKRKHRDWVKTLPDVEEEESVSSVLKPGSIQVSFAPESHSKSPMSSLSLDARSSPFSQSSLGSSMHLETPLSAVSSGWGSPAPSLRRAPSPPIQKESPKSAPKEEHSSIPRGMLEPEVQTDALFTDYSDGGGLSEVSRSLRDKLKRLKQRISDTRRQYKENKLRIDKLKQSNGADKQQAVGKLELENRLLVERIARLAKKYRELSNQIKRRKGG